MIEQSNENLHFGSELTAEELAAPVAWYGWYWLALGAALPAGILLTWADAPLWRNLVTYGLVAVLLVLWQYRGAAVGSTTVQVPLLVRAAFMVAIAVVGAAIMAGDPQAGLSWYTPVALSPSIPCLLTGWSALRR